MASKAKNSDSSDAEQPWGKPRSKIICRTQCARRESGVARRTCIWNAAESRAMTWRIGFRQNGSSRRLSPEQPVSSAAGGRDDSDQSV